MKKNIKIDFISNTIIVAVGYYERAQAYGSDENKTLTEISEAYPNMKVVCNGTIRKKTASEFKGITYAYMRAFITNLDEKNLITFEKVIEHHKLLGATGTKLHRAVARWFLENYPRHRQMIVEAEPQPITKEAHLTIAEAV